PSISDLYEHFFQQVASVNRPMEPPSDQVLLNGEPAPRGTIRVSAREILGLTESEMALLNDIAADCANRLAKIEKAGVGLTMAARLERIAREIGEPDGTTRAEQRQVELEIRRREVIAEDMRKLKTAF